MVLLCDGLVTCDVVVVVQKKRERKQRNEESGRIGEWVRGERVQEDWGWLVGSGGLVGVVLVGAVWWRGEGS